MDANPGPTYEELAARCHTLEVSLDERAKELWCHNAITELLDRPELVPETFYRAVVEILPAAFRFPDSTSARLTIGGTVYGPEPVTTCGETLTHAFSVSPDERGSLTMYCDVEPPTPRPAPAANDSPATAFLPEEVELIAAVTQRVAMYARRIEDDRRRSEREALFGSILHSSPDIICVVDPGGVIRYASERVTRLFGTSRAIELFDRPLFDFLHPDDHTRARVGLRRIAENRDPAATEFRALRPDGSSEYIEVNGSRLPDTDDGEPRLLLVIRDIGDRHAARIELERSEQMLRSLVNSQTSYVLRTDLDGYFTYVNRKFAAEHGVDDGRALYGTYALDTICEHHHQRTREIVDRCIASPGTAFKVELDKPHRDGRIRTTLWEFVCLTDGDGAPTGIQSMGIDITERTLAEHRLATSEANYRVLFEGAPDGYFIMRDGKFAECNRAAETMLRGTRDAIIGKGPVEFSPEFQPNGRRSDEYAAELLDAVVRYSHNQFEWIHRRFDGTEFLTDTRLSLLELDDESVILASWRDISAEREAQNAVTKSEERLLHATMNSRTVVWEVDVEGMYTYVSLASEEVFGYRPDELINMKHFYDLTPEDRREEFRAAGLKNISAGAPIVGLDNPVLRKDGSVIWVSSSGTPLLDAAGAVTGFRGADFDITDRKRAEDDLRIFRTISDEATYGTAFASPDGILTYVNGAFAEMHGYSREELVGRPIALLHSEDQQPRINEVFGTVKQEGGFTALEVWHRHRSGRDFPTLMSATMVGSPDDARSLIAATAVDITELKAREFEVLKLTLAMEQSPAAIVVTDLEGIVEYVSPAFSTITGYAAAEIIGQPVTTLRSGETAPSVYEEMWSALHDGRAWEGEWINRKKNGELYPEHGTITPVFDENGRCINYLKIGVDMTVQKRAEAERTAREVAERASQAKSQFLSNMSHEIRTPLNAIIGFSQILAADEALSGKQLQQVRTIHRSGEHLLSLINDILDLSKIEAGQIDVSFGTFSVARVVHDIASMFEVAARSKGLRLSFVVDDAVPGGLFGTEGKLRQILINLVGNAMKFTAAGSIIVRLATEPRNGASEGAAGISADLPERDLDLWLVAEVTDTGTGIADADRAAVFSSFGQTDEGRAAGGTGLGLTISKRIVEHLGGSMSVTSTVGRGSTFRFRLPCHASEVAESMNDPSASRVVIGLDADSPRPRVLIVDDVEENRSLLRELLAPLDLEQREATSGQEAIDLAASWDPGVILMDLRMPGIDGRDAAGRVRAADQRSAGPRDPRRVIVAITASAFDAERAGVLAVGFDDYIRKPFRSAELFEALSAHAGLSYRYAEDSADAHAAIATEAGLATIDADLRARMIAAVEGGNMRALREMIEVVRTVSTSTAATLETMAQQYEYEALIALLSGSEEDQ